MKTVPALFMLLLVVGMMALAGGVTGAATDCSFTTTGTTDNLDADCTTDATILVPDGITLNGRGHTITAVDPSGGHFVGAVVQNEGTTAHVTRLTVTADGLANVCDAGADRLRGVMFEGASGTITHTNVAGVNQGASGCQEGNAIEVRNAPFDGTGTNLQSVEIAHNTVAEWQKTGIVCNGDVSCDIHHNDVSASTSDKYSLAPNSIQIGFGAHGIVKFNNVEGSSWCGPSAFVGTAMLLYEHADGSVVQENNIRGDSDVGIYNFGGDTLIDNNKVFDDKDAENCNVNFPDSWGIGNWGVTSEVTNNKVKGFGIPYDEVDSGNNKAIPGPNK